MVKSENSPHLLTPIHNNGPTAPLPQENDPLLDVLDHLPDLQPDQTFDVFPTITSPMRPYTDHPFLGNAGGQDLSAYFNSIIAHQDLEEALSCTTGNAEPNPTALLMPSSSSNDKVIDDTGAACCSSGTKILQKDTDDVNHDTGAQNDLVYSASGQLFHLYNQSQLHSNSAEMEPPNIAAQFSADTWAPHPQQLFSDVVEPSGSDMTNSDAFDGLEGWATEPMMQQATVTNLLDPQQGTAARRIRLVHSVQRATITEPVLTLHLESEDEAGSSYSTGNSSTTHDKDYANLISQTTAGEATHVQNGGLLPTREGSSVEVTEKSREFSFDGHISSNAKLPHEANLKQRLKVENTKTSQNARDGLQDSDRVPREPSYKRQQHAPIASVVRLLCLALFAILAFVCLWKSSLCKSLH